VGERKHRVVGPVTFVSTLTVLLSGLDCKNDVLFFGPSRACALVATLWIQRHVLHDISPVYPSLQPAHFAHFHRSRPALASLVMPLARALPPDLPRRFPVGDAFVEGALVAASMLAASRAPETLRKYKGAWAAFESWAKEQGVPALPASASVVVSYLGHLHAEGLAPASLRLALAALVDHHRRIGLPSPRDPKINSFLRGLHRTVGAAPKNRKAALTPVELRRLAAALPQTISGLRDRALFLLAFSTALRRVNVVELRVEDIERRREGLLVHVRRSKTDQEGRGHMIAVHRGNLLCPVEAVETWLEASRIGSGWMFRKIDRWGHLGVGRLDPGTVSRLLKKAATRAGLDPEQIKRLAGHSFRSGHVTTAARAGAGLAEIASVTNHRRLDQVREYIRETDAFRVNTLAGLL
jgi:integrase